MYHLVQYSRGGHGYNLKAWGTWEPCIFWSTLPWTESAGKNTDYNKATDYSEVQIWTLPIPTSFTWQALFVPENQGSEDERNFSLAHNPLLLHCKTSFLHQSSLLFSCLFCDPPRTVAHQAPLSMGFPRQDSWSGLPCPSPGDLPHPGIEPRSPALQADSLPQNYLENPHQSLVCC